MSDGGCSGFSYQLEFTATGPTAEDTEVTKDGAAILVDNESLEMMRGSTINLVEENLGHALCVEANPQAVSGCGCGTSFSVASADEF